jgi:hypothetical protein
MSGHNLLLHNISWFCWFTPCFNTFIPGLVQISLDRFFPVFSGFGLVFLDLATSRTGLGPGPAKKGDRTRTGPDFKALYLHPQTPPSLQTWVGGVITSIIHTRTHPRRKRELVGRSYATRYPEPHPHYNCESVGSYVVFVTTSKNYSLFLTVVRFFENWANGIVGLRVRKTSWLAN